MKPRPLRKPLVRRVGQLVVTIDACGITLRRFRGRKRLTLSWEQVASLTPFESRELVLLRSEQTSGTQVLRQLLGDHFRPAVCPGKGSEPCE